jgi:hypothetical protein
VQGQDTFLLTLVLLQCILKEEVGDERLDRIDFCEGKQVMPLSSWFSGVFQRRPGARRQPEFSSGSGRRAIRLGLLSLLSVPAVLVAQDFNFNALVKQGGPQLSRVETEPDRGNAHVATGTPVAESEPFPLSGPHWPQPTPSGFYKEPQPKGKLIHALEHGQVVVYYDAPGFKALSVLKRWSEQFSGPWSGLIAVPHKGLGDDLVVTAWRHRLRLPELDEAALAAFIDAYSGRGPENRVR